jgi:small subunit ribosomal protein S21|tara:strand:+ start:377 stop:682 length:306 start_codon:yes stop_codon:yes gene_type:complete
MYKSDKPRGNFNANNRTGGGYRNKFQKKHDGPPPFDVLLRQFKKKVERSGLLKDLKKYEFYEKPAQKRRRKKDEAIRRNKKELRMEAQAFDRGRQRSNRLQ